MSSIKLNLDGWVLRKPRVASANAITTSSPDTVENPSFDPQERADYFVSCMNNSQLRDSEFAWSKSTSDRLRMGYSDVDQRWVPLPGISPINIGMIQNDPRIKVPYLPNINFNYRFFITDPSAQNLITCNLVTSFSNPVSLSSGVFEINTDTLEMNFSQDDVDIYEGENVYYQGHQFVDIKDPLRANIGLMSSTGYRLALSPIPEHGMHPIIRIGYQIPLHTIEVDTESNFTSVSSGTVQWSLDKGTLNFNTSDIISNETSPVYYWGVYDYISTPGTSPLYNPQIGTVNLTGIVGTYPGSLPLNDSDLIIYFTNGVDYKQIEKTIEVDEHSTVVKYGTAQVRLDNGLVKCNVSEVRKYLGWQVYAVLGDFNLDGEDIKLRLFRSFVNKNGADETIFDVSCFVSINNVTFVEKLIASPILPIPISPIEPPISGYDSPSFTVSGEFDSILKDLKTYTGVGDGFIIDYHNRLLTLCERKSFNVTLNAVSPHYNFPDVGILEYDFQLNRIPESGPIQALTEDDYILDSNAGVVFFTDRKGKVLSQSTTGYVLSNDVLQDTKVNFTSVLIGKQLVILSGANKGSYIIESVLSTHQIQISSDIPFLSISKTSYEIWDNPEILCDRVWEETTVPEDLFKLYRESPLGLITNSPRLSVPIVDVNSRLSFMVNGNNITVEYVNDDTDFTSTIQGTAQISITTGNVNFSTDDILDNAGFTVYGFLWLYRSEYILNSSNGAIILNTPLSSGERLKVYYYLSEDESFINEYLPIKILGEQATFTVGSTIAHFNPDNKGTLSSRGALIWIGNKETDVGRYYRLNSVKTSDKVSINWDTNTIQVSTPFTSESEVIIEYHVMDSFGGEISFSLSSYPIFLPKFEIISGETAFEVYGEQTALYSPGKFILLDDSEIYKVSESISQTTSTIVVVTTPFKSNFSLSTLKITSEELQANYFEPIAYKFEQTILNSYEMVFKDSFQMKSGTVLDLDDDFYMVLRSFIDENGRTHVQVSSKFSREYTYSYGVLERSIRPVFTDFSSAFISDMSMYISQPVTLNIRKSNSLETLILGNDYTVSESGLVTLLTTVISGGDSVELNYTGRKFYPVSTNFTGKYIYRIIPSASNGYLGATLKATYTVYSPDTFYFRVEPFQTISNEVSVALGEIAVVGVPSSGPPSPPPPPPGLNEKGGESFYWNYGDLSDSDSVSRRYLLFYTDVVNAFEDFFKYFDGRVVGDVNGKFLFDGNLHSGNPVEPSVATNHIDSVIYTDPLWPVFPSPPFPSGFPFRRSKAMWKGSKYSRFYPERGVFFTMSSPSEEGGLTYAFPTEFQKEIAEIGREDLASVSNVKMRLARTRLLNIVNSGVSSATLEVESTLANSEELRFTNETFTTPSFEIGDQLSVSRPGYPLPLAIAQIVSKTDTSLVVLFLQLDIAPIIPTTPQALSVDLLPNDTVSHNVYWWVDNGDGDPISAIEYYRQGFDYIADLKEGKIINITFPIPIGQVPIDPETYIDGVLSFGNKLTTPYRFPALDGSVKNDQGDLSIPYLSPSSDVVDFNSIFSIENLNISSIENETIEGFKGDNGSISIDLRTFDLGKSPTGLNLYDTLYILTGSNSGKYLITSITGTSVGVSKFKHQQDNYDVLNPSFTWDVSYTVYDGVGPTVRYTSTDGQILSDLNTLKDTTVNFLTLGNEVQTGDTIVINSSSNYFNNGTYIVLSATSTELSIQCFNTAESNIDYVVEYGTARVNSTHGYFSVNNILSDTYSPDFSFVVKGDILVVTTGKNIGKYVVDTVYSTVFQVMISGSSRLLESDTATLTLSDSSLTTVSDYFQVSDVGRYILITDSVSYDGEYVISSVLSPNKVVLSGLIISSDESCNFSLECSYHIDNVRRGSSYVTSWKQTLLNEQSALQDINLQNKIQILFYTLYSETPNISGISGSVISTYIFKDIGKDYSTAESGDCLEITSGDNIGFYFIEEINGDEITIDTTGNEFVLIGESSLSYNLFKGNSRFSEDLRNPILSYRNEIIHMLSTIDEALLYATIGLNVDYGDPTNIYLNERNVYVDEFLFNLSLLIEEIENAVTYIDKLYDKRFSWIDFRINLEKGTLPKIERLVSERDKNILELEKKILMLNS